MLATKHSPPALSADLQAWRARGMEVFCVDEENGADTLLLIRHRDGHLRLPAIIGYYGERTRFRERWIGALERLDLPALILWGRLDPVAVPAVAEVLAAETPGAQLVWMDDLGHYPQLEDPQRVVMEVERFLASR